MNLSNHDKNIFIVKIMKNNLKILFNSFHSTGSYALMRTASCRSLLLAGLTSLAGLAPVQAMAGAVAQNLVSARPLQVALNEDGAGGTVPPIAGGSSSKWVNIVQFRFTGNTLFPSKALAAVLAGDLDRPMGYPELHALAGKVAEFYRAHGALALVVLPAQDISSRKVTFVVVEAIPGKLPMEALLTPGMRATRSA